EGPARPGNRFCMAGAIKPNWPKNYGVALMSGPPKAALARFFPSMILSFDYWAGAATPGGEEPLTVGLANRGPARDRALGISGPAREAWTHLEIKLARFMTPRGKREGDSLDALRFDHKPYGTGSPPEEGDRIDGFAFRGGKLGGAAFYIDNIRLTAPSE